MIENAYQTRIAKLQGQIKTAQHSLNAQRQNAAKDYGRVELPGVRVPEPRQSSAVSGPASVPHQRAYNDDQSAVHSAAHHLKQVLADVQPQIRRATADERKAISKAQGPIGHADRDP